jgi:iron complex outermembrane receptor protein
MLYYCIFARMHMMSRTLTSLASLALGLLASPASAQEAPQALELDALSITSEGDAASDPVSGFRVSRSASATKTDTALEDTPQAVSVIPRTVLDDLGSQSVERALEYAGGVAKQNDFGGLTLYEYSVRGFTTSAFYKDGFSADRGYPATPDAANIERIDVLKGPAASLYGRGDPGGTVNIVTKKPQPDAFARLHASAGSWDRYRTSLDLNTPLDEQGTLLSRINLAVEDNQSFREHVDSRRLFVAPSLSWQLSEDTQLLVESEFVRHASTFDRGIVAPGGRWAGVSRRTFLGEPNDGRIGNDNNQLQVALEHRLDADWSLRLASHYKQGELSGDASEARALGADGRTVSRRYRERDSRWHDSISQAELHGHFATGGWRHELLIGAEFEDYRKRERVTHIGGSAYAIDLYQPRYGQPAPNGARSGTDFAERLRSRALTLQDQIAFTERLRGLLGVRYEHLEQRLEDFTLGATRQQRHDPLTYRAGLLYQFSESVGVFANVSTSFKPNNGLGTGGATFKPEQGLGIETGVKAQLLDDRLSATLAVFSIDKRNVLALDPDSDRNRAVGKARSQGLDLQFSGQLSDALRVIGAYAYIDAQVTEGDRAIPTGSRILGVARHSGSLLAVHEFQQGRLRGSDVGAAFTYVGDRLGEAGSSFELPAYHTVDLLAHYKASDTVTLGLNLNNIFDERYYERAYSDDWVMPGAPRNFTVSVAMSL